MNTTDVGRIGERIAEKALRKEGMKVLDRNYRFGHWEIDLILWERKTGTIVFAEVKARSESTIGLPREAVTYTKQKHLRRAAEAYCLQNGYAEYPVRFDVVEVWLESKHVERIENAF